MRAEETSQGLPRLETARLTLTLPRLGDAAEADEFVAYLERNSEHLAPWSPPEPSGLRTRKGALHRIQLMHAEYAAGSSVRLWLRRKAEPGQPLSGAVSLSQIFLGPFRACYLGYQLDHDAVGQGLMQEALTRVIDYAFSELRLHRLMANYAPTNERSGRLLRRLGFVVEGYARDYLFIGGRFCDHVLTSLTNDGLVDAERLCTPG
jgi:[ribosomal protein S5]-alanine N-acetyltransferase